MFDRDTIGATNAWQDVYRAMSQFCGHLHVAILKGDPILPGQSHRQLDMQIAQLRLLVGMVQSHCKRLDHEDTVLFEGFGMLGHLWGPWLGISQLRHLHKIQLQAYAELLQAYLEQLEAAHHEVAGTDSHGHQREQYPL